jgi:ADP-ribose pyrophosphatase YjhB (NUDIX family)
MESGESVTEGCEREVFEETGLHVKVQRLIGVYSNPNMLVEYPDGNRWQIVILYFLAETIGGELQAGDDALDAGYFSLEEIEHMKVRALDRQRIADVFADQKVAFIRDDIYI